MSQPGESDSPFQVYARGGQAWEKFDVFVLDGRLSIVVDYRDAEPMRLTRIQSEELARWLGHKLLDKSDSA